MAQPTEIPASEVRGQISEVISRVAFGGERVVISRNGKAQAAVIPIADLDRLKQLDEQRDGRRRRAAQALADIQAASAKNGTDKLTDDDLNAEISEVRRSRRKTQKQARR